MIESDVIDKISRIVESKELKEKISGVVKGICLAEMAYGDNTRIVTEKRLSLAAKSYNLRDFQVISELQNSVNSLSDVGLLRIVADTLTLCLDGENFMSPAVAGVFGGKEDKYADEEECIKTIEYYFEEVAYPVDLDVLVEHIRGYSDKISNLVRFNGLIMPGSLRKKLSGVRGIEYVNTGVFLKKYGEIEAAKKGVDDNIVESTTGNIVSYLQTIYKDNRSLFCTLCIKGGRLCSGKKVPIPGVDGRYGHIYTDGLKEMFQVGALDIGKFDILVELSNMLEKEGGLFGYQYTENLC